MRQPLLGLCCGALLLGACSEPAPPPAATPKNTIVADQILVNGKVLTVDAGFSITEAIAIRGERILATGTDEIIRSMADDHTQVLDLQGRTVIPGLIDNHHHFVRATEQWYRQVRWDEVTDRRTALTMLQAKAARLPSGEWVVVLGGWIFEQFSDDSTPFTRVELDAVLPDNPLYIQLGYSRGYVNSLALGATGIDAATVLQGPGTLVKDANGALTGELIGSAAFMAVAGAIPATPSPTWDQSMASITQDYVAAGLTALLDVGGNTVTPAHYEALLRAKEAGGLPLRIFYTLNNSNDVGATAEEIINALMTHPPRSGDDRFGQFAYGEMSYSGIRDAFGAEFKPGAEELDNYRRIVEIAADRGWQIHEHANRDDKIAAILGIFEEVNQQHPMRELRWTLAHNEQISGASITRAMQLGMGFAIHSSAGLGAPAMAAQEGRAVVSRVPPIQTIHNLGAHWGLGSDGTVVAGFNPFLNLAWAVTGKSRNGEQLLNETVLREAALTAHTRGNAWLLFKEEVLGSIEPGKYADLVVLDRDYLEIEADEIQYIKPVITMIGGKVVYTREAAGQ